MSQKIFVVMFGHRSLAGKDTSAEYMNQYGWRRLAFADKLKSTVADLYNFSHEQMHGELKDVPDIRYPNLIDVENRESEFLTPRRILQIFGQDQRKLYPNIWAQYVFNQIDNLCELSSNPSQVFKYVITDFRFRNEYEVAKIWSETKIEGPPHVKKILLPIKIERDIVAKSGSSDISEHDLDDFDDWVDIIHNSGTIEDLHRKLDFQILS